MELQVRKQGVFWYNYKIRQLIIYQPLNELNLNFNRNLDRVYNFYQLFDHIFLQLLSKSIKTFTPTLNIIMKLISFSFLSTRIEKITTNKTTITKVPALHMTVER